MYAKHTVRDALSFTGDPSAVRGPIIRIVDAGSEDPPHIQILAAAGALVAMAEAVDIDPVEVVTRVRQMQRDINGPFTYVWDAVRDYARGELLGARQ